MSFHAATLMTTFPLTWPPSAYLYASLLHTPAIRFCSTGRGTQHPNITSLLPLSEKPLTTLPHTRILQQDCSIAHKVCVGSPGRAAIHVLGKATRAVAGSGQSPEVLQCVLLVYHQFHLSLHPSTLSYDTTTQQSHCKHMQRLQWSNPFLTNLGFQVLVSAAHPSSSDGTQDALRRHQDPSEAAI